MSSRIEFLFGAEQFSLEAVRMAAEIYPIRLHPGQDLKKELHHLVEAQGWSAAWVLGGIGSLRWAAIRYADRDETTTLGGPLEIVSMQGTLSPDGAHLHLAVSDSYGEVKGGHLQEGSEIYTTAEVLIQVLPAWGFSREHDEETGCRELVVQRIFKGE